jgi:hypothetical protein
MLEQAARDQLTERNQLLLLLWQKLSAICGREWTNDNALIDRQVLPSLEVIANRLPGFSRNLLAAVKAIEGIIGGFQGKIKAVERDLTRDYQNLENNLDVRTKKLDRLETMVRNSIATGPMSVQDKSNRVLKLEEYCRQLKVEIATLRTANDVRSRSSYSTANNAEAVIPGDPGSPSPSIPRGPGDRDRDRVRTSSGTKASRPSAAGTRSSTASGAPSSSGGLMDVALSDDASSAHHNDNRWLFRLRDMEYKLKMEREGRNQDRQAARQRLSGLESENRGLRERARRVAEDEGLE